MSILNRTPKSWRNLTSILGFAAVLIFIFIEAFLIVVELFSEKGNLYLGLLTYTIFPVLLFLGGLLIVFGIFRENRRLSKKGPAEKELTHFVFDSNNPKHVRTLIITLIVSIVFLMVSSLGTYKAYHYTESVEFCGTLCHDVMNPEYIAHQNSSHAKLSCVECHIGSGVDSYIKAKFSGLRQVKGVLFGDYAKPIPTPVHNLRSAAEICEECHWPNRQFKNIEKKYSYFIQEEDNKKWNMRMMMRTRNENDEGIHAHMNLDNDIYYVAEDEKRENITWIKSVNKNGEETIYMDEDSPYQKSLPPAEKIRKMDCLDCHNRPAHKFTAPYKSINEAMSLGQIDPKIPAIKEKALEVLDSFYETKKEGLENIRSVLKTYYSEEEEEFYSENTDVVTRAIDRVEKIFEKDFYPEMKVRWSVYPDHLGHLISEGCFRCHDDKHVSAKGKKITRDCNACHVFLEQGYDEHMEKSILGLDYAHPTDIDGEWKEESCSECHTGGVD